MERSLKGRVAVVTGAGVRVGRAIAEGLGAQGANVVVHYSTSIQGADAASLTIRSSGSQAVTVQADLTDSAAVEQVFRAADSLGGCDILVNSAAIFERRPLEQIDDHAWRRMVDINLAAPFFCCRAAVKSMQKKHGGDIINIADVGGGLRPWSGLAHYCSSKAGLAMLTRCLALELAPHVRVNAIAPGPVMFPETYSEEEQKRALARVPLARQGSPSDVVDAVLFLLQSKYVTGQILAVDGGRSIA